VPPPTLALVSSPAKITPKVPTIGQPRKGRSIADKLKEFRAVQGAVPPVKCISHVDTRLGVPVLPEHLLLRDTLYLLQGISGKYVQFSRESEEKNSVVFVGDPVSCYAVRTHSASSVQRYRILEPTKALIHQLAEVGHLYIRVDAFVREKEGKSGVGMIEQSLCHHLQTQLTEYYRLIAILESQMGTLDKADDSLKPPGPTPTNDLAEEETGLTLKRLDVWIDDWRLRMRMMSVCVEGAKGIATSRAREHGTHMRSVGAYGGALVSIIHGYTDNGDPFVRKFTDQLLEEVRRQLIWKYTASPD
jgi:gamma-tubulin complex component 3